MSDIVELVQLTSDITGKLEKSESFTNDQIREIEAGKASGVDVSIYAKPYFLAVHMHTIRTGLEQGLDVSLYATPDYDWFQMEEIRLGLEAKLDVKTYADPKIDYSKMRIIREGLMEGMYLKPFAKYPAGVMRQMYLAKKSDVDLSPFVDQGYREAELESIRVALEKNIHIESFITPEFNGESIKEVATGLERGLEVELYAYPEYNWEQMRELRRGLESRVDISRYRSHYYHAEQMREIRLGMEEGIDVTPYATLMYTAKDMHRIREDIKEELRNRNRADAAMGFGESTEFEEYVITIGADEMSASLTLLGRQRALDRTRLVKEIMAAGVVYGVNQDMIDMLVEGHFAGTEAVIARGTAPVDGTDGYYEYLFDLKQKHGPVIREDGSVDHMDLNNFCMVKKGDKIAFYHNAKVGTPGSTVTGKIIPAQNGKEKAILVGKGFILEEDQKTYVSVMNGRIEMRGGKITITNVLTLKNISLVTGSVVYDGDLHVLGDVEKGSIIKVTGNVVIDGNVEAANIDCGGTLVVQQGISAGGHGSVKVGGKFQAKYLESANVEVEGDVLIGYSVNSRIYTKGKLTITSTGGMLTGGHCTAENGIEVENLGNRLGVSTRIEIGSNDRLIKERQDLEKEIKSIRDELQTLYNANNELSRKVSPEMRSTMDIFVKIENAIYTKELEMREKEEVRKALQEREASLRGADAIIHGRIFEGVKISIANVFLANSANYQGIRAYLNGERVSTATL